MANRGIARLGTAALALVAASACDPPDRPARFEMRLAASEPHPLFVFPAEDTEWASPGAGAAEIGAVEPEPVDPSVVDVTDPAADGPHGSGTAERLLRLDAAADALQVEPEDFPDARFERPRAVRGLYVNAWAAGSSRRMGALIDVARETEVNALVIDIKDATGFISHRTEVELAHTIGATEEIRIADLPGLLDRLEAERIYPIARIVIVKDPILTAYRPEYAIQDTAGGVWIDGKGISWLNPYREEVWRYHVDLAREVAEMGFPEVQWDYVRFPDAPQAELDRAVYLGRDGRERHEAIRGFLSYARANLADLPVRSTADVFGVTTSYHRDVGTGQVWEQLIDVVDVALPMVYPSHYWPGSFGYAEPNARPYEIVRRALEDALRRSAAVPGAGLTRPWLQDFTLGKPAYAGAEVRAQIQATYDAGIDEWILWNPGSRYTVSALEPVGGFEREPLVRVAGVLALASRRQAVIDSIAALPPVVVAAPDSVVAREAAPDSTPAPPARPDSAIGRETAPVSLIALDAVPDPTTAVEVTPDPTRVRERPDALAVPGAGDAPAPDSVPAGRAEVADSLPSCAPVSDTIRGGRL